MFNFFVDSEKIGNTYQIVGNDYNHIKNVLRMKIGDTFLVSSGGKSHLCELSEITDDTVIATVIEENYNSTELPLEITLFQGLPKSDKLELIIQKTVELGVARIVPVEMKNCVVKLDDKKKQSKVARWQAIAESAAKQSKRNIIPTVGEVLSFKSLLNEVENYDLFLVPFESEKGIASLKEALSKIKPDQRIAVLIGPEGGFSEKEIAELKELKTEIVSLGKRILRTETAAITALSALMLYAEINL